MTVSEQIHNELIDMVQKHDYSYMYSDSHSVWQAGVKYEREIQAKIHALCAVHREDAQSLLDECLTEREEQYTDGLTHRIIRGWFKPYVGQ